MQKDNLYYTVECNQGARMFAEEERLPRIEDATLGRTKLISDKNRYIGNRSSQV